MSDLTGIVVAGKNGTDIMLDEFEITTEITQSRLCAQCSKRAPGEELTSYGGNMGICGVVGCEEPAKYYWTIAER